MQRALTTKEYIYNLQQQIYFLEVQNNLLKNKLTESKKVVSRGTEASPILDAQLSGNQNLNTLFERLQEQYSTLKDERDQIAGKYEQQIEQLKKQVISLKYVEDENKNIKEKLQKEFSKIENDYQNKIKQQQQQYEELKQQVKEKDLQIQLLTEQSDKLNQYYAQQQKDVLTTKQLNEELQCKVKILQSNTDESLKTQNAELQVQLDNLINDKQKLQNNLTASQTELQKIKINTLQTKQQADLAILESQQLKGQCKMLDEINKSFQNQITQLRDEKDQNEIKIKKLQAEFDRINKLHIKNEDLVKSYMNKVAIDELKKLNDSLNDQLKQQSETYLEADNKIYQAQIQVERKDARIKQLEEQLSLINTDNVNLTSELQSTKLLLENLKIQVQNLKISLQKQNEAKNEVKKENLYLKEEIAVKEELSQMKIEEFQQLAQTNKKLYGQLEKLNKKFNLCGDAVKGYVDILPHDRKVARQAYIGALVSDTDKTDTITSNMSGSNDGSDMGDNRSGVNVDICNKQEQNIQ